MSWDRRTARSACPAPAQCPSVAARSARACASSSSARTRTAQSLSSSACTERLGRLGRTVGGQRVERRRRGAVYAESAMRGLVRLAQRLGAPFGLERPELARRRARGPRSPDLRAAASSIARRSGAFRRASARQHRRNHPLVLVLQHRAQRDRSPASARQRAEHLGQRRAHAPVAIRLHARQHGGEALLIDRRGGAQRRGAHRRPLVGQQILDRRQPFRGPQRAERRHRFEPDVRMCRRCRAPGARGARPPSVAPSCGERADRGDASPPARPSLPARAARAAA